MKAIVINHNVKGERFRIAYTKTGNTWNEYSPLPLFSFEEDEMKKHIAECESNGAEVYRFEMPEDGFLWDYYHAVKGD